MQGPQADPRHLPVTPTTTRPPPSPKISPAAPFPFAGPGYLRLAPSGTGEVHP